MSEEKAKEERKQEMSPEQAKLILNRARQKDVQNCKDAINEDLKKFRCGLVGTITIAQGTSSITVKGIGANLKIDIVPLMEE